MLVEDTVANGDVAHKACFSDSRVLPEVSWIPFYSASQSILSGFQSSKSGYVDMRTSTKQLSRYDLDDCDVYWLELVNTEFREQGTEPAHSFEVCSIADILSNCFCNSWNEEQTTQQIISL